MWLFLCGLCFGGIGLLIVKYGLGKCISEDKWMKNNGSKKCTERETCFLCFSVREKVRDSLPMDWYAVSVYITFKGFETL
jgi:hypothetical protein